MFKIVVLRVFILFIKVGFMAGNLIHEENDEINKDIKLEYTTTEYLSDPQHEKLSEESQLYVRARVDEIPVAQPYAYPAQGKPLYLPCAEYPLRIKGTKKHKQKRSAEEAKKACATQCSRTYPNKNKVAKCIPGVGCRCFSKGLRGSPSWYKELKKNPSKEPAIPYYGPS